MSLSSTNRRDNFELRLLTRDHPKGDRTEPRCNCCYRRIHEAVEASLELGQRVHGSPGCCLRLLEVRRRVLVGVGKAHLYGCLQERNMVPEEVLEEKLELLKRGAVTAVIDEGPALHGCRGPGLQEEHLP